MPRRRPFLKHKLRLYFDENCPEAVIDHFLRNRRWKKRVSVTSATMRNNIGRDDHFHFTYCLRNGYALVTLDRGFVNDTAHPFQNGSMRGIIVIRASSADIRQIVDILSGLLSLLTSLPLPKVFASEAKFVAGRDTVLMRGRDLETKEIKEMQVVVGRTEIGEILAFFSF
jgi:Domain of unknown function (DUF5615)